MRLTVEQVMQDNKLFANCNALAELNFCGWDIPHRKSITNDEIHFYAWLCRSAVALLKEQKEQILNVVWDILHDGVSTDTVAEQDWVYEQIRHRVDKT